MVQVNHPTTQSPGREFTIPIAWESPEGQRGVFANHLVIQFDKHEFHLLFYELLPPLLMGDERDRTKVLESLTELKAKCVARIVVSRDRMPAFVKVLDEHVKRHTSEARS